MTIDEAIKLLDKIFHDRNSSSDVEVFDAIQIGIEALKVVKFRQDQFPNSPYLKLPGERSASHE